MGQEGLDKAARCSFYVLMRARRGPRVRMKRAREGVYRKQLDVEVLVRPRSLDFRLLGLRSGLSRPAYGSRRVILVFDRRARNWASCERKSRWAQ